MVMAICNSILMQSLVLVASYGSISEGKRIDVVTEGRSELRDLSGLFCSNGDHKEKRLHQYSINT